MTRRGIIYKTKSDKYCIAYTREQLVKYAGEGKLLVEYFDDLECKKPTLNPATNLPLKGYSEI